MRKYLWTLFCAFASTIVGLCIAFNAEPRWYWLMLMGAIFLCAVIATLQVETGKENDA